MNLDNNTVTLFDNYLKGEMSKEAAIAFENLLIKDSSLQHSFSTYKQSVEVINKKAFMEDIAMVMEKEKNNENASKIRKRRAILSGIAASTIILITITITHFFSTKERLEFSDLYKPYPNILNKRAHNLGDLDSALEKYSAGEFKNTINLLHQIKPKTDTIYFYKGLSHLTIEEFDKAILSLKTVPENSIFYMQSKWYLALAHYASNSNKKAIFHLKSIHQGEFKYEEAQALITQME